MVDQVAEDELGSSRFADNTVEMKLSAAIRSSPMLESIRKAAPQKLMDEDERAAIAGIFAQHAAARTSVGMINWASRRARQIYRIRNAAPYRNMLHLTLFILLLVAIWEPPTTGGSANIADVTHFYVCTAMEVACSLVFAADLLLQMVCCTPRVFMRSSKTNVVFGVLVLSLLADVVSAPMIAAASGRYPFRWSRMLRPLLMPFLSQTVAHMVLSMAHTLPSLADLGLCMLIVIVFYALLSTSLFAPDDLLSGAQLPAAPPPPGPGLGAVASPLRNLHTTLLELVILLFTADNYPMVMWESYSCTGVSCGVGVGTAVFTSFVLLGNVVLMSVFVAVLFDVYKRQHGFVILQEKIAQRKALLAAFALLDLDGDGKLDEKEFSRLLRAVRPAVGPKTIELAFRLCDSDNSSCLDREEFLQVSELLMLRLPAAREPSPWVTWSSPLLSRVAESTAFGVISDLLIVLYIFLLIAMSTVRGGSGSRAVDVLDTIFVCAFTVEIVVKILGLSLEAFWSVAWNRLDVAVVFLAYMSMGLEAGVQSVGSGVASLRLLRLLRLMRLIRMVRVFGKISGASMKTRVLVATFAQFGKVVAPMGLVLIGGSYVYAIIGMEFLQGALSPDGSSHWQGCSPHCPSFEHLGAAALTLLHMLVGANWSPILEEAVNTTGRFWSPVLYFLSYVLLSHVFMLSLLAALVLEVYAHEMDRASRHAAEDKLAVLLTADEDLDGTSKLAETQVLLSSAVRRKFGEFDVDHSGSLAVEELSRFLEELGSATLSEKDLQIAFDELDQDRSGLIEYEEFLPWWRARGLRYVFDKHDLDHSGMIDSNEFHNVRDRVSHPATSGLCRALRPSMPYCSPIGP